MLFQNPSILQKNIHFTSSATVLLFNKIWDISRTAWEVEFGPRKLAGQCSWPSPKNINFGVWSYDPKISKSWSELFFFFAKIFLRKFFIEFPNKNIFSTHIFERKNRENINISRFFLSRKCWSKNIFVRKSNEKISKNIFFRKFFRTNFSKILEHSTKLQSLYFSGMVMNINLRACGDPTQLPMLCVEYPISYWIIIQLLGRTHSVSFCIKNHQNPFIYKIVV